MNTTIYWVRHAKSPFSKENERLRGLSPDGIADAERVTEILAQEQLEAVVSSPYTRAIQTVQGAAAELGLEMELEENLRERLLAGLDHVIEGEGFMAAIERVFTDQDYALPGGESNHAAQQRGMEALQRVLNRHQGKRFAIGTHGNIMTILMSNWDSEAYGLAFWKQISSPDIYKMTLDAEQKLVSVSRIWPANQQISPINS
ncbi:2,3-bisphosphoglycerate-dependent phosphoglycerate mutase [Paenibacillus sp. 1_12]|uniref:histidine phosphatase family protein n=1 Tax=Paenibacillus sp. 1_12 TaxID=1566278 RepID=UPI0008E65E84|nr:histidine phosphatase family protein [Paenibacillus sp. 1_12]SFL94395.1 2,3-bisphosphoglycerate-dependent phosphoglycerate mutase [Paenibacillus sp. 1_12]